jgi:hypothetical protein
MFKSLVLQEVKSLAIRIADVRMLRLGVFEIVCSWNQKYSCAVITFSVYFMR